MSEAKKTYLMGMFDQTDPKDDLRYIAANKAARVVRQTFSNPHFAEGV